MKCDLCEDGGWVCESHPHKPWFGERACRCGGAGMPCPWCNGTDKGDVPGTPEGSKIDTDKNG